MRSAAVLTLLLALASLPGCVSSPVAFTSSTVPAEPGEYTVLGEAEGSAWGVSILTFPVSEPTQAKTARDRAIASYDADGLVNVTVWVRHYTFILVSFSRAVVRGEAIRFHDSK